MHGISPEQEGATAPAIAERRSQGPLNKRSADSSLERISEEQLAASLFAPEPRMAALSISNDALRDSLRVAAPPSIGGWIKARVNPWWRHVDHGYGEATYWLWARAPWQRWAISLGSGALVGLAVVVVAAQWLLPEVESVGASSGESVVASAEMASATAMVIAPLRGGVEPPAAVAAPQGVEPPLAADRVEALAPDAPTSVEVSEQIVEAPAAAPERSKSKKRRAKHARRRAAKTKNASSLSKIFLNMRRAQHERTAR